MNVKRVPTKEVTIKLGSPEEANLLTVGMVEISKIDRAVGEVTFRVIEGHPGWSAPRAQELSEDRWSYKADPQ